MKYKGKSYKIVLREEDGVYLQSETNEDEIIFIKKEDLKQKEENLELVPSMKILPINERINIKEFNLQGKAKKTEDLNLNIDDLRILLIKYHKALIIAENHRISEFLDNDKKNDRGESKRNTKKTEYSWQLEQDVSSYIQKISKKHTSLTEKRADYDFTEETTFI